MPFHSPSSLSCVADDGGHDVTSCIAQGRYPNFYHGPSFKEDVAVIYDLKDSRACNGHARPVIMSVLRATSVFGFAV